MQPCLSRIPLGVTENKSSKIKKKTLANCKEVAKTAIPICDYPYDYRCPVNPNEPG